MITKNEVEHDVDDVRALLQHGHRLRAALKLQHVVEETSDPALLHEIERVGEEGLEGASIIERPNWMKVIGEAERRDRAAHAGGLTPGSVEITPAQARALAELAEGEGALVLHQLGHSVAGAAPEAVYATPRGSARSHRIAPDGTRAEMAETSSAA